MSDFKWNEGTITAALARNTFDGHLCCLPNTTWTGAEVDLLVVHRSLRVIDCEVKISRADLKADIHKDKWWRHPGWPERAYAKSIGAEQPPSLRLEWPDKVWKHYYAMPEEIWRDDLLGAIPQMSGVLLVKRVPQGPNYPHIYRVRCARPAKPNRDARPLTAAHLMHLARLTSIRLWTSKECAA